jgi:hypothetical protein
LSGRLGWLLVAGVMLVGGLSACGGSSGSGSHPAAHPHRVTAADISLLQGADCNLWRNMPGPGRQQLLAGYKSFFGGQVDAASSTGQRGTALGDKRAAQVFDSYCRLAFAGRFKLYKIYGRAAAFSTGG